LQNLPLLGKTECRGDDRGHDRKTKDHSHASRIGSHEAFQ
jgi:hypothetical protein